MGSEVKAIWCHCRGIKESVWEGGVRGAGFVWSPLLQTSGYTSTALMQIEDFLPTLLSAAGYDNSKLPLDLDGMDQWSVLSKQADPVRTEILHSIDDVEGTAALRIHDMKLVVANGGSSKSWPSWYSPDQFHPHPAPHPVPGDLSYDPADSTPTPSELLQSDLPNILQELGRPSREPRPLVVQCGKVTPETCKPGPDPCLFNVTADPCEQQNLAQKLPSSLNELTWRLEQLRKSAVPPRNKPVDPEGFPSKHDWIWVPWRKEDPWLS